MCGFAGILNSKKEITRQQAVGHAGIVSFRGPDSCRTAIFDQRFNPSDRGCHALFFNRLAIVDLDHRSDQPFENERYLLVFNGEIYNYQDLKNELSRKGIIFHTTSDTEVLFHLINEYGTNALRKLNGMFAFFWLDKQEKTFILARDRLGIKPVYYSNKERSFSFGSELHSVLRFNNDNAEISNKAIEMYLWMQYVPTPYSIIEGISKLPPGHFISGPINNISDPIPYWDAYEEANLEQKQENDNLEIILKNSVERQLHADVPIGLFLSSGVDSSLLASIVNKYFTKDKEVNFFTVSFKEDTTSNESKDAINFINGFKNPLLKNHVLQIDADFIGNHLEKLYQYYDEPFGDPASLLNWVISLKARNHVTVAISGDGADELFWGYSRYEKWMRIRKLNVFPIFSKIMQLSSHAVPEFELRTKLQRAFRPHGVTSHFDQFLLPAFRPRIRKSITNYNIWATQGIKQIMQRPDLTAVLDIKTYLADAMLYKVDRSSMAASLEVRVPYLDNEVVDFALHLPFNKKSNANFKHKAILKELLQKLAPHYNIQQPKKGFNFPLESWLRSSWKDQVLDLVTPTFLKQINLDPVFYRNIITNFYIKNTSATFEVWYLFNLALWMQHFNTFKSHSIK